MSSSPSCRYFVYLGMISGHKVINLNATTFLQDFRKTARDLVLLGLLTLGRLEIRYCGGVTVILNLIFAI